MKKQYWLVLSAFAVVGCAQAPKMEMERKVASTDELYVEPLEVRNVSVVNLQEKGGKNNDDLPNCGGHATVVRDGTNLVLKVRDANCGSYSVNGGSEQRLKGEGNNHRSLDYNLKQTPGSVQEVTIGSGKYFSSSGWDGNADRIRVTIASQDTSSGGQSNILDLRNWSGVSKKYDFPNCKGSVIAAIENNKVNIKINDTNCGTFDIVSNEGNSFNYDSKPIPSQGYRYGGSFTLPKAVYSGNYGYNGVRVKIYNRGYNAASDSVLIQFNVRGY